MRSASTGCTYLVGYPSALDALAEAVLRTSGSGDLGVRAVITNAEPLAARSSGKTSKRAFRCPVRETYGMSEIVAAANQCEHGAMHLWPEAGVLEICDGSRRRSRRGRRARQHRADEPRHAADPLRTGDRCALGDERPDCPCGRTLPLLGAIEGRADDILYTRDGRRIGRLDPIFKASLPIQEAQIVQEALDRVRVIYVPDAGFTPRSAPNWSRWCANASGESSDTRVRWSASRAAPTASSARSSASCRPTSSTGQVAGEPGACRALSPSRS